MNVKVGEPIRISENIYQFNEASDHGTGTLVPYVDSYLIVGEKEALVVDTLQTDYGLYEAVRKITDKPITVLITHGHLDHAGVATKEFYEAGCPIYMSYKDYDLLKGMLDYGEEKDWFIDLKPGMVFDIGGYKFRTFPVNGHSQGSMVFLDSENQLLFSGDGIGSGAIWMQLPFCTGLSIFREDVKALFAETKKCPDLLVYPGHRNQSPVQLTGQYVRDVLYILNGILNGVIKGEEQSMNFMGREMHYRVASHGMMHSFCFDPNNLRHRLPDPKIEAIKDKFTRESVRSGSKIMDYMFFTPEVKDGEKYPLVIYLHGAGERGTDPRVALANSGGTAFAKPEWQEKHPCYVLAPQVSPDEWWADDLYIDLIAKLVMELPMAKGLPIDPARVYITGLSMGGMGTWRAITKYPQLFAAAMPICGGGDPFAIKAAKNVPVWAFHAIDDPVVPAYGYLGDRFPKYVGSRWMVHGLRRAGGIDVRYTEYPAGYLDEMGLHAHFSWVPAYDNEEAKEWLFSKTNNNVYDINMIQPGFYYIEDNTNSSLYIIEGTERALVVDTGMTDNDFIGMVKSVTKLPFDLAVTHCHGDHMYHLPKFDRYYMSEKDLPLLDWSYKGFGIADCGNVELMPIKDGDLIDLGGGYEVEVFDIGGHTPGSVAFLDKKRNIMLVGDAIGVWMQVPNALTLSEYKKELIHFAERLSAPEYANVVMLPGHFKQQGGYPPYGDRYAPNDLQKVKDLITLCDMILNEEVEFAPYFRSFDKQAYAASYGQASIVFTEDSLK